ncbi:MAG: AAA family ATPase [Candidatus Egerieousia sp.]
MLTRLKICELFKIYSYDIQFQLQDDGCITIITGPNGYGKTTILNLINALYNKDYTTFFKTQYKSLEFYFDDKILEINRSIRLNSSNEESDDNEVEEIVLDFCFKDDAEEASEDRFILRYFSDAIQGVPSGAFELFMQTRTARYVTDSRLVLKKSDTGQSAEYIDTGAIFNVALEMKAILEKSHFTEEPPTNVPGEIGDQLRLFSRIIKDSCFADKTMSIDPRFGITFKNSAGEYLLLSQLSSGEKHILIQAFELIFKAQSGTVALVDEPEISFHPAWVIHYVENIEEIQRLKSIQGKPFQVILATHSPQLIGERWDMTRDLFDLKNQNK